MRAAGQVPDPRPVEEVPKTFDFTRLQPTRTPESKPPPQSTRELHDRLGPRIEGTPLPEVRTCHQCGRPGHVARHCPSKPTSTPTDRTNAKGAEHMTTHKTSGHICETCGKQGHTSAQCWTAHPELVPEGLQKKRQSAMTAANRQKRRATEYVSPGYKFQGNFMALTYKRPQAAMAHRRSARASRPTVTFQLVDPKGGGPRTTAKKIHNEACPLTTSNPSSSLPPLSPSPLKKAAGEERDYVAQLPQTFPHGLPP